MTRLFYYLYAMIYNGNVFIKKIKAPVYRTPIWIVVSNSIHKSIDTVEDLIDKKLAKPEEKRSIQAYTYAYEKAEGKYHMLLFFKRTAKPGTIAHECKHLINLLFMWHGAYFSMKNDEMECYYLDWLVDQAHGAISMYKRVITKKVKKNLITAL